MRLDRLDVLGIELVQFSFIDAAHEFPFVAEGDSSGTGNTGPIGRVKQDGVLRQLRPGSNQAHIAAQDVVKLWQLIDLEFAHEAPEHGNPAIARLGETLPVMVPGAIPHTAEFVNREAAPSQPDALLGIERAAPGGKPNAGGQNQHGRRAQDQYGKRKGNLDPAPRPGADPLTRGRIPQALFEGSTPIARMDHGKNISGHNGFRQNYVASHRVHLSPGLGLNPRRQNPDEPRGAAMLPGCVDCSGQSSSVC